MSFEKKYLSVGWDTFDFWGQTDMLLFNFEFALKRKAFTVVWTEKLTEILLLAIFLPENDVAKSQDFSLCQSIHHGNSQYFTLDLKVVIILCVVDQRNVSANGER